MTGILSYPFRTFEAGRKAYSRLTFGIKMVILGGICLLVYAEYRQVMTERSDLLTTDARSVKSAVLDRLYGVAMALSNMSE